MIKLSKYLIIVFASVCTFLAVQNANARTQLPDEDLQLRDEVTILPIFVEPLDDESFDSFLAANGVVIVDNYASWCGPCCRFGPVFEKVAREMFGMLSFAKLDVDHGARVCKECKIISIPTVIIFKDGQEIARSVGGLNEKSLKEFILSVL